MALHDSRQNQARLTEEEFALRAIHALRTKKYKGIHTVYSGFNSAFRQYFDTDPVEATKKLAESGKIILRPAHGGATIYDPKDAPPVQTWSPSKKDGPLDKILKD